MSSAGKRSGKQYYLTDRKVGLRAFTRDDITAEYIGWLNDPDVNRYLWVGHWPSSPASVTAFFDSNSGDAHHTLFAIDDRRTERMIGTLKVSVTDPLSRVADLGMMIGSRTHRGKGYGRAACLLAMGWCFGTLNIHRLSLGVLAENAAAIGLYERVGFRREGCLRQHSFQNGRHNDCVIMALLKPEWEARSR